LSPELAKLLNLIVFGGSGPQVLSLGSTMGAWLLALAGRDPDGYVEVGARTGLDRAGADVLGQAGGLLVMGDGTARLGERAPGGADLDAARFDDRVAGRKQPGDAAGLAGLDLGDGERFLAAGVTPWRAAGALAAARPAPRVGRLMARSAPYGVSYLVATWTPAGQAARAGPTVR